MPAHAARRADQTVVSRAATQVPDDVRQGVLAAERDLADRAVGGQHRRGVLVALEARRVTGLADLVDDQQVAALAGQLGPAVGQDVAVGVAGLGREADEHLARRAAARDQLGEHVGVLHQLDRSGVVGLLDLGASSRSAGRKSATAAAITTASATAASASTASRSSSAVVDPDDLDAGRVGQRDVRCDQDDLGAAGGGGAGQRVALLAAGAVAEEAHRVEGLAGAPGGDDDAAAGEVRRVGAARSRSRHSAASSAGSGSRPLPVSAPVSRPTAGSTTMHAARAQRGDVGLRGGVLPHLGVHRRRNTTGQRAVSRVLVSRSSARPCAAAASRSAVAGATTTRSAAWPIRTCGTSWTSSQTSVGDRACRTAPPRSARRRTRSAAAVGTTRDVVAGLGQLAEQLDGLVRRDAAGDAEDDPGHGATPPSTVAD